MGLIPKDPWNVKYKQINKNKDLYESNSEIYNINIRFSSDLHTPNANLIATICPIFYVTDVVHH